jgi:hypothetical protein
MSPDGELVLTKEQVAVLVYDLVGTTQDLDLYLEAEFNIADREKLAAVTLEEIDSYMFECEYCGWWCDDDERSENGYEDICKECVEDNE